MNIEEIKASLVSGSEGDELIVFLHGMGGTQENIDGVVGAIRESKPNADILPPLMPYGSGLRGWLCRADAAELVACMLRAIDQLHDQHKYQRIIFTGHSLGAVLSRKIAIVAHGESREAPFEKALEGFKDRRRWAGTIQRIVLLAGMNHGWTVSSAMDWLTTAKWAIGSLLGEFVWRGRQTIFAIRRGAPFLVQTRLQWLALMRTPRGGEQSTGVTHKRPDFFIVQLLGNTDDLVAPDDNVDFAVDLGADRMSRSYLYLEVPHTDHASIIQMAPLTASAAANFDPAAREVEARARNGRRERFKIALTMPREQIAALAIPRDQLADSLPPKPNKDVSDIVLVIHGIRDKGFWTQKIAGAIKKEAAARDKEGAEKDELPEGAGRRALAEGGTLRSFTGSYGYFAMAPFMFRPIRRRKVEWLMDNYAELRARYPEARVSYVGHSNGTYLLTDALCLYPASDFKHVLFAGSVVRRKFEWHRFLRPSKIVAAGEVSAAEERDRKRPGVDKVLNYVATDDWVVALLPKAVEPLRIFDLGGAGFDGFAEADQTLLYQVRYVKGKHDAGIRETQWDHIAKFIVRGRFPPPVDPDFKSEQNERLRRWSERSYWLFWVVVVFVLAVGAGLLGWTIWALGIFGLVPAVLLLVYYKVVKTFITQF